MGVSFARGTSPSNLLPFIARQTLNVRDIACSYRGERGGSGPARGGGSRKSCRTEAEPRARSLASTSRSELGAFPRRDGKQSAAYFLHARGRARHRRIREYWALSLPRCQRPLNALWNSDFMRHRVACELPLDLSRVQRTLDAVLRSEGSFQKASRELS